MKARDALNRRAMSLSTLPTAADMDTIELTDSSDDGLPEFEELLRSSQKSSSSQKTLKRLESMKLENDGFEMMSGPSSSAGSFFHSRSYPVVG